MTQAFNIDSQGVALEHRPEQKTCLHLKDLTLLHFVLNYLIQRLYDLFLVQIA